jgi:hypothetical protein
MSRHKLTVGREGCYHSPNAPPLGQDPGYHSQVAGVFVSVEQGRYIVAMKTTCLVRNREGLCYELAGKVMLDEPGAERFTP